jgi:hypothetical protein
MIKFFLFKKKIIILEKLEKEQEYYLKIFLINNSIKLTFSLLIYVTYFMKFFF